MLCISTVTPVLLPSTRHRGAWQSSVQPALKRAKGTLAAFFAIFSMMTRLALGYDQNIGSHAGIQEEAASIALALNPGSRVHRV